MSNNNQVSFRVDSRLFYTLIAIVAVVGILAIGMWIGTMFAGGGTTPTQTAANPGTQQNSSQVVAPPVQGGAAAAVPAGGVVVGATPVSASAAAKGIGPVSIAEQPVGKNEPRIAIDEINKDNNYTFALGNIPADRKSEKEFTLKNVGTAELIIESTTASCGCTAAVADKKELKPGESTILHVGYDPRVNQEYGKFVQKQIRIKSNDPVAPLVEYTINAQVAAQ
jgi:hypothetical protein